MHIYKHVSLSLYIYIYIYIIGDPRRQQGLQGPDDPGCPSLSLSPSLSLCTYVCISQCNDNEHDEESNHNNNDTNNHSNNEHDTTTTTTNNNNDNNDN